MTVLVKLVGLGLLYLNVKNEGNHRVKYLKVAYSFRDDKPVHSRLVLL
jgi:hypothetical protein